MSRLNTNASLYNSIYRGVVVDIDDPKNLGRCRILVPSVYGDLSEEEYKNLPWARPIGSYSINVSRGNVILPDIDDIVWVFYEGGAIDYPLYFGGVYGENDPKIYPEYAILYEEAGNSLRYERESGDFVINIGESGIRISDGTITIVGNLIVTGNISSGYGNLSGLGTGSSGLDTGSSGLGLDSTNMNSVYYAGDYNYEEYTEKIGHARKNEDGRPGDSTGNEVCVKNWYRHPWQCVLRHNDINVGVAIANAVVAGANNNNIGYDQSRRNTLLQEAKKVNMDLSKINTPCDTDCSAFVMACAISAGIEGLWDYYQKWGNSTTTSTITSAFTSNGFLRLSESKYTDSPDYLYPGDIILAPGSHVAVSLGFGSKVDVQKEASNLISTKGVYEFFKGGNFECPYNNVYTYMGWQMVTAVSSSQYQLRQEYFPDWDNNKDGDGSPNAFNSEGFGMIDGRYVVATTSKRNGGIAEVGDPIDVYLENGELLKCIVGDIKSSSDENWTKWGHRSGKSSVSTIEFIVNRNGKYATAWYKGNKGSHENPGTASCHPEWRSRISKIVVGTVDV